MNDDNLAKLVKQEAMKSGVSSQQANKALKMLRDGKINMSQIAPQLKTMIMKNVSAGSPCTSATDLKERMATRRKALIEARQPKEVKQANYEKTKKQMADRKQKQTEDKLEKQAQEEQRKIQHEKDLIALEAKLGKISVSVYNKCMEKINEDKFSSDAQRENCQNIISLYHKQQGFQSTINLDNMLCTTDDLSDIED